LGNKGPPSGNNEENGQRKPTLLLGVTSTFAQFWIFKKHVSAYEKQGSASGSGSHALKAGKSLKELLLYSNLRLNSLAEPSAFCHGQRWDTK